MVGTKLKYTKKQVRKAGEVLVKPNVATESPEEFAAAMDVLSNWRSSHIVPLDKAVKNLEEKTNKLDKKGIVVHRLKRTPSIISKLLRFETMKLRTMQDIAGCRSIVTSIKKVHKLKRELLRDSNIELKDNYIKRPKADGYRGIHLVGYYSGVSVNRYKVEIQLRSRIQHSWATAVEIIDLFTKQAIKSNQGKKEWKDFFKEVSKQFALFEGEFVEESEQEKSLKVVTELVNKLGVKNKFEAFAGSLNVLEEKVLRKGSAGYYLLLIDLSKGNVNVTPYKSEDSKHAMSEYLVREKEAALNENLIVALVSTDSITNLKKAYPNYFADSTVFMDHLNVVLEQNKGIQMGWLRQQVLKLPRYRR
ncbi:RelA/SpoT domain-containing protein [Kangiella sp. M94]